MVQRLISFSCGVLVFVGCARSPIKSPDRAMRPAKQIPTLNDDLEFQGLIQALESNLKRFKENGNADLRFGPKRIPKQDYIRSLEFLLAEAKSDPSGERFRHALKTGFEPFEVYGSETWGEVFITSYFEPVIEGALKPGGRFKQPLYGIPKNMVEIDLNSFALARPSLVSLRSSVLEQRSRGTLLRGLLLASSDSRTIPKVVAVPDRAAIDSGALQEQAPILAWVDPIDAFFLEIQGSGVVRLHNGKELKVGYASQNGHSYVAIGKYLMDVIPKEQMSLHTIEAHLRSLPEHKAREVMQQNPSFVFFQKLQTAGQTFFGTDVVPGRTIATDQAYFPKGALAFLEFERPVFKSHQDVQPTSWLKTSRFVLDQDTGGAIRGPHRVDLFWGRGAEAKQHAGVMKNKGRLVYFVPREDLLSRLSAQQLVRKP